RSVSRDGRPSDALMYAAPDGRPGLHVVPTADRPVLDGTRAVSRAGATSRFLRTASHRLAADESQLEHPPEREGPHRAPVPIPTHDRRRVDPLLHRDLLL